MQFIRRKKNWEHIEGTIFARLRSFLVSFFLCLFLSSCAPLVHPLLICELGDTGCDSDRDGVFDGSDNCVSIPNPDQADIDKNNIGDACDTDVDGDNVSDFNADGTSRDLCPESLTQDFISNSISDYDGDGCEDDVEDDDDDSDGIDDFVSGTTTPLDLCRRSKTKGFQSDKGPQTNGKQSNDYDRDGCQDDVEDNDDDNRDGDDIDTDGDGFGDTVDLDKDNDGLDNFVVDTTIQLDQCPLSLTQNFISNSIRDYDGDGCEDDVEDDDDDSDGIVDFVSGTTTPLDLCRRSKTKNFISNSATDNDRDGCEDAGEDIDDDDNGLIEIQNAEMLNNIRNDLSGKSYNGSEDGCGDHEKGITECSGYELENNIDLSSIATWPPIAGEFTATLDGKGHTIIDLAIVGSDGNSPLGFFESIGDGGGVQNLAIREVSITGSGKRVGSLAGELKSGGSIERVTISNSDLANGGLRVNLKSTGMGGLVGKSAGMISNSSTSVFVCSLEQGKSRIGGLVGENTGTITNAYATGNVCVDIFSGITPGGNLSHVGGLVGWNNGSITNTYSAARIRMQLFAGVNGKFFVGGLVGTNSTQGTIMNSYTDGGARGNNDLTTGDLVGKNTNTSLTSIVKSYSHDSGASEAYSVIGKNSPAILGASKKDLPELTASSSGWSSDNWDFGSNTQYPSLRSTEAINGEYLLLCGQIAPQVLTASETRPADQQCP